MPFKEPNFRCRVAEDDMPTRKFSRLIYAENEAEARELLKKRRYMIFSVKNYDFALWKKAADKVMKEARKARGSNDPAKRRVFEFRALWAPLKEVLLEMFHGKCAYCDAQMDHVAWGDVEHFRPKAAVTEDPTHPGYYWLAYDPSNYLPSCQKCNQSGGKENHFPVSGKRAYSAEDRLADERPDLLRPLEDDFCKYLKFYPSWSDQRIAGTVEAINSADPRAKASIDTYRLNRPRLQEVRLKAQREALIEYRQAYNNWILNDVEEGLKRFESSCFSGVRQFAAAALAEAVAFAEKKNIKFPATINGARGGA